MKVYEKFQQWLTGAPEGLDFQQGGEAAFHPIAALRSNEPVTSFNLTFTADGVGHGTCVYTVLRGNVRWAPLERSWRLRPFPELVVEVIGSEQGGAEEMHGWDPSTDPPSGRVRVCRFEWDGDQLLRCCDVDGGFDPGFDPHRPKVLRSLRILTFANPNQRITFPGREAIGGYAATNGKIRARRLEKRRCAASFVTFAERHAGEAAAPADDEEPEPPATMPVAGSSSAAAASSASSADVDAEANELLQVQIRAIMLQHAEDLKRMQPSDAGRLAMESMAELRTQRAASAASLGVTYVV